MAGTANYVLIDFNPRPPWGGRPDFGEDIDNCPKFQSTPSVGRATINKNLSD